MSMLMKVCVFCLVAFVAAGPAMAQEDPGAAGGFSMNLGAALGAGLVIIGAGLGIGRSVCFAFVVARRTSS